MGRGLQPKGLRVKETADFKVYTKGAGSGELKVTVKGPSESGGAPLFFLGGSWGGLGVPWEDLGQPEGVGGTQAQPLAPTQGGAGGISWGVGAVGVLGGGVPGVLGGNPGFFGGAPLTRVPQRARRR